VLSLLATPAAAACSGSDGSSILGSKAAPTEFADAGIESLQNPAAKDATTEAQPPPPPAASSGAPYVGRGDNFSSDPTDAGIGDAAGAIPAQSSTADAAEEDDAPMMPSAACPVTFEVEGVFIDGVVVQNVVLGGDVVALGSWEPTLARNMTLVAASAAAGAWSVGLQLPAAQTIHFKFGKRASGQVVWETLPSADAGRTLTIECPDNQPLSYVGQFGVLPDGG
jgi:hypothetical protein